VVALSDESAMIVEKYEYDIFGKPTIYDESDSKISDSAVGNRYMFTGRRYDPRIGLYYYRARYYHPEIGRFLQPDPIGYAGGMNLYGYCGNNPVMRKDAHGLFNDFDGMSYSEVMKLAESFRPPASKKLKPEELLRKLGSYGNPYGRMTISRAGAPSQYYSSTVEAKVYYRMVADALTSDYGILNSVGTGSGWAGSLQLTTWRRLGSKQISYHQLKMWEAARQGIVAGDLGDLYGWVLIKDSNRARRILLANPKLMKEAIDKGRASGIGAFFESLGQSATRHP
jgi:RHS repeat-associated protein